jgi:nucleoside-diphosphate-sugar epimerase
VNNLECHERDHLLLGDERVCVEGSMEGAVQAILLGGTGAMGAAAALRLAKAGWDVEVTGRDRSRMPAELTEVGVRFHQLDRSDTRGIECLVGSGTDLLVDLVAFRAAHVRALLPVMMASVCPVLVSSRAVYVDSSGRHVNGAEPPQFDRPVREDSPTLPAAGDDMDPYTRHGYGPSKVAVERVALDSGLPVTVLRPSKVHGPWARNPRTLGIVDLILNGERTIRLAEPDTIDHLSASANIARLIETVAEYPGPRILNAADPDTPTATQIVEAIGAQLEWKGRIEPITNGTERGHHPWRTSMTLDTTAAQNLGYHPVGKGIDLLKDEIEWIRARRFTPG